MRLWYASYHLFIRHTINPPLHLPSQGIQYPQHKLAESSSLDRPPEALNPRRNNRSPKGLQRRKNPNSPPALIGPDSSIHPAIRPPFRQRVLSRPRRIRHHPRKPRSPSAVQRTRRSRFRCGTPGNPTQGRPPTTKTPNHYSRRRDSRPRNRPLKRKQDYATD